MEPDRRLLRSLGPLALVALVLAGCGDDPQAPAGAGEALLTFEIDDYFLNMFADEGIVFVSDGAGEPLGVGTWSGAGTVALHGDGARPDSVSFTFVGSDATGVALATTLGVPVGSVVGFGGAYAYNPTGEAGLDLENIPAHDGYLVASSLASSRPPIPLTTPVTIPVHWDAVDVFVRFDTAGGWPRGGWAWSVEPGETRTLDLAEPGVLVPLVRHATKVPAGGSSVSAQLGYDARDGAARQIFSFSADNYYAGAIPDSVIMFGPNIAPGLQSSLFAHRVEDATSTTVATLSVRGEVPTAFAPMPGTLTIVSAVPDAAAFAMTGDWDRFAARWYRQDPQQVEWYVEGTAPLDAYALPRLPPEVLELAPGLVRADLALQYLIVEDDPRPGVTQSLGVYPHAADAVVDDAHDAAGPHGPAPRARIRPRGAASR